MVHYSYWHTVYNYASVLETASPRFSTSADFFTYVVFVCIAIVVGNTRLLLFFLISLPIFGTSHYLPA